MYRRLTKSQSIVEAVTNAITKGELKNGERLQSIRRLAAQFETSPPVVQSALDILERNDLIIRKPRSGVVVKPHFPGGGSNSGKVLLCLPASCHIMQNMCRLLETKLKGKPVASEQELHRSISKILPPIGQLYQDIFELVHERLNLNGLLPVLASHDLIMKPMPNPALMNHLNAALEDDLQAAIVFGKDYIDNPILQNFPPLRSIFLFELDYPEIPGNAVLLDFEQAFYMMTAHLAKLGRKRIMFSVSEPHRSPTQPGWNNQHHFLMIYGGYERALREYNLANYNVKFTGIYGSYITKKVLADIMSAPNPPDAIMCHMDFCALNFIKAAQELGIRVPEDLAITGFFNTAWSDYSPVKITTVGFDTEELVNAAVALARDLPAERRVIYLKPQLCIKDSCGATLDLL
ncbi:substrate-binding domain-containing protein [Victivallis sp. Marseille-Q1083]|uniref:substrate-binding domain-containing protein n=1 Tax=Victivallis sp. Marseille-Q1083 TaxID=2717288 RepID=UPI00158C8737|nr:substrate-binding domain-containing protein [Victivallis sp. Marseille-Q1083]